MNWLEAIILGFIQGLTEFLPVSSSGHLTIGQTLLGIEFSEGDMLLFDVFVHAATVLSTIVILWKEIEKLFAGTFLTKGLNEEKIFVGKILLSMIPVFIIGMFFKDYVEQIFGHGMLIVGICLLLTAILLLFAQYAKPRQKEQISWVDAFVIGLGQACAVLPGLSRSGTTIATGILLGNKKESVAQFSFLMVLIPILGETLLDSIDIAKGEIAVGIGILPLMLGFAAAFITGCLACKLMLNLVKRQKLIYFAIYCVVVGIFAIVYSQVG